MGYCAASVGNFLPCRFLSLEDGTDRLPRNVGEKVPLLALITQKSSYLITFAAEARNHANFTEFACRVCVMCCSTYFLEQISDSRNMNLER